MFACNLELHPNISSYNTGGSKYLKVISDKSKSASPIFENEVGFKKDKIKYKVFDEVHAEFFDKDKIGFALIRDFKSINNSIKLMYKKLHGIYIPFLRKSPYLKYRDYEKLLDIAKKENVLAISTELFIQHPNFHLNRISNFLKIKQFPNKQYIISKGCNCGNPFRTIKTKNLPFEANKLIELQEFLYCDNHKSVFCGPGGFNPLKEFDTNKISNFNSYNLESFDKYFNNQAFKKYD